MADNNGVSRAGKVADGDADLLSQARAHFRLSMEAFSDTRDDELDDLRFYAGSPDNQWQWPADVLATRGAVQGQTVNARPTLTINKLPQHVKQVTNDQRQNRPSGKVIPVDDKADVQVAEMLNGIIRHIEYISDADVAYDTACENQVVFGEGYIRLLTDYIDEMSFEQEIKIGRIRNAFSCYDDPMIQDPAGADRRFFFVTVNMLKEDFEREYPDALPISNWETSGIGDPDYSAWLTQKTVRVAEYWYYETEKKTVIQYQTTEGTTMALISGSPQDTIAKARGWREINRRDTSVRSVKWCKLNGFEVLERGDWAGKWIPFARVVGNEFEVDGQIWISGLVRNAKDPQRMYNYWCSQEAEMLALAPKAPFVGYGGQFEGYEYQWKTANIQNWPYLEVNSEATDQEGRPLPLPQRAAPPLPQAGLIQAKMGASDDIKSTTGQYDPSLGAKSNETSGRAIIAREKQSDVGTYHYPDNLAKAIRHLTRMIVDLVPKVYDTQRIVRILGLDGEVDYAKLDPMQERAIVEKRDANNAVVERIYNPGIGRYDVMATTGPSYMTKRHEAAEGMSLLLQGNPDLWKVAGDLFVKNLDWPGAQELAERFAKIIPAELRDNEQSPELAQAQQQIQALAGQLEQAMGILRNVQNSYEQQKLDNEHFKADVDAYRAQTDRFAAMIGGMTPENMRGVVRKVIDELMAEQPLEQEEPAMAQSREMHTQGVQ